MVLPIGLIIAGVSAAASVAGGLMDSRRAGRDAAHLNRLTALQNTYLAKAQRAQIRADKEHLKKFDLDSRRAEYIARRDAARTEALTRVRMAGQTGQIAGSSYFGSLFQSRAKGRENQRNIYQDRTIGHNIFKYNTQATNFMSQANLVGSQIGTYSRTASARGPSILSTLGQAGMQVGSALTSLTRTGLEGSGGPWYGGLFGGHSDPYASLVADPRSWVRTGPDSWGMQARSELFGSV